MHYTAYSHTYCIIQHTCYIIQHTFLHTAIYSHTCCIIQHTVIHTALYSIQSYMLHYTAYLLTFLHAALYSIQSYMLHYTAYIHTCCIIQHTVTIDGCKSTSKTSWLESREAVALGPLLWILYTNDLLDHLECEVLLFANDTCMFASVKDPVETTPMLNRDLIKISAWAARGKVSFNPSKTKQMIFSNKLLSNSPPVLFNNIVVEQVYEHKHLGIWLTPTLWWSCHIQHICMKANSKLAVLRSVRILSRPVLDILYRLQIRSVIDYGLIVFFSTLNQSYIAMLNRIQYRSARLVTGALQYTSRLKLDADLGWEDLGTRYEMLGLSMFHKIFHNNVRRLIKSFMPPFIERNHITLSNDVYKNFPRASEKYYNSFIPHMTRVWNCLEKSVRNELDIEMFKVKLKNKLKPPKHQHYKYGNKYINSLMCQLRVGRTYLKADSFAIGLSENNRCECCEKETVHHYFYCRNYEREHNVLFTKLNEIIPKFCKYKKKDKISILLYGVNLTLEEFD